MRTLWIGFAIALAGVTSSDLAARPPDTWDGLLRVRADKLDVVYLTPDADFRPYTKVIIDKPQVAFRKNWQRNYNTTTRSLTARASESDMRRAIDRASTRFSELLGTNYAGAGYQIVTSPGPDVLRLTTGVINVEVAAPDTMRAGRSLTFSDEAGEATLVVEARDSETGALLGRALDRRIAGDGSPFLRNSVSNRSDFDRLFRTWAKLSVEGLGRLKALSPVDADGVLRK